MANQLGKRIAQLRREKNMTQEQLATLLGISYQAVSKWENGHSCPDVMMLPQIADLFETSIDALFGRTDSFVPVLPHQPSPFVKDLPWPDDDALYAVLYRGHRLLGCEGMGAAKHIHIDFEAAINGIRRFFTRTIERAGDTAYAVELHYEGPVRNLTTNMSVHCENCRIEGNVQAGDGVNCQLVAGNVHAGDGVNCENIGGNAQAGDSINCREISGSATAGDNISCSSIGGNARAGDNIRCGGDIGGDVHAGDSVTCANVSGSVSSDADVRCACVNGNIRAGGDVHAGV